MDIQQIFNAAGLNVGIVGAFTVFFNSPKIKSGQTVHSDEEVNRRVKIDRRKNRYARYGMLLVALGFIFQLAAILF